MKTARISVTTKWWMFLALILALLTWVGIAAATTALDEQFIRAAERGNLAEVKDLFDKGAQVNATVRGGVSAFMIASFNGDVGVVNLLLEKGAHVNAKNEDGFAALTLACRNGHITVAKLLLEQGADVNSQAITKHIKNIYKEIETDNFYCQEKRGIITVLLNENKIKFNYGISYFNYRINSLRHIRAK